LSRTDAIVICDVWFIWHTINKCAKVKDRMHFAGLTAMLEQGYYKRMILVEAHTAFYRKTEFSFILV
jgi:hypothetical protein